MQLPSERGQAIRHALQAGPIRRARRIEPRPSSWTAKVRWPSSTESRTIAFEAPAYLAAILRHAREITGNVSKTCRHYGITRQAYCAWLRRYEDWAWKGCATAHADPYVSPNATRTEVVGKIV